MSIHTWKQIEVAERKGAWASDESCWKFFDLSKRELIEAAIRLAGLVAGSDDDIALAADRLNEEVRCLRANDII